MTNNPHLPIIIPKILANPIYHRFLNIVKVYEICEIYDCHAHISSGRGDIINDTSPKLMPQFPFTVLDVNHLYDELFRSEDIEFTSVIFDTPLTIYNMDKKNDQFLKELDRLPPEESNKVVPFAVVTPDMRAQQIQKYVELGARGFKMTPRTSSPYIKRGVISDITLADMLNPDALRVANSKELPLVVHLPQLVVSRRIKDSLKEELLLIADEYPYLKIVLAHLGQSQTPAKIMDLLRWIDNNDLSENIWMDISAVTVPSVLEIALSSNIKTVFGTDIDFSLTEQGKYIMFKYSNGHRVMADEEDMGNDVATTLVSTNFGEKFKPFAAKRGIDLNAPLFLFQLEGIIKAIEGLQKTGRPKAEIKSILENLFFRNAKALLKDCD